MERAGGYRPGEVDTLSGMAKAYLDLGDKRNALRHYTEALHLARAASDYPALQGATLGGLMSYWQAERHAGLAIFFGKQAINQYQDIRRNIQGL
jgi:tetratricopeptide (TPR) repeat protein